MIAWISSDGDDEAPEDQEQKRTQYDVACGCQEDKQANVNKLLKTAVHANITSTVGLFHLRTPSRAGQSWLPRCLISYRMIQRLPSCLSICTSCDSRSTIHPATCSRVMRATRSAFPVWRASTGFIRAKRSRLRAMIPVQPVWWLAPRPAPLSPWKYS